jgi:hypothetical protein
VLIVSELTMTLVLLAGAGFMIRSFLFTASTSASRRSFVNYECVVA